MAIFTAGQTLTATALNNAFGGANAAQVADQETDSGTVTSATYTADRTGTANEAGVAFVAPTTGKVLVHINAGIFSSTGVFCLVSFEVRNGSTIGSGTVVTAAADAYALQSYEVNEDHKGATFQVSGLTAGNNYNAQLMYRTQSGTLTIDRPDIIVQPVLV